MGCDIHMYVERQKKDGSWVRVPNSKGPKHPYYDPSADEKLQNYFNKPEWDIGRNYIMFGRLAGVRNQNIVPIVEQRGVPSDMSSSTKKEWVAGQGDWHSASWLTAKEIAAVRDEKIQLRTCLSMKLYKEYLDSDKKVLPEEDDNFMWGRPSKLNLISNSEMERIIALSAFWDGVEYYTDIISPANSDWELDMHLWDNIIPAMLAIESDPEKIRIVFWFDN